jgi:hypothetical protein
LNALHGRVDAHAEQEAVDVVRDKGRGARQNHREGPLSRKNAGGEGNDEERERNDRQKVEEKAIVAPKRGKQRVHTLLKEKRI